jgi:hypothetical protein
MMQTDALLPPQGSPLLPLPRDRQPTIPFELEEYARWSCLPDGDDDLVFTAGPPLEEITSRVPYAVADADLEERLSAREAFMLSLVDDVSPVRVLVDLVGGDPAEALVVICDLYARGVIAFA